MKIEFDAKQARAQMARLKTLPVEMRRDIRTELGRSARLAATEVRREYRAKHKTSGRKKYFGAGPAYRQIVARLAKAGRLSASLFHRRDGFWIKFLELGTKERFTSARRGKARRGAITADPVFGRAVERQWSAGLGSRVVDAIQRAWDKGALR